MKLLFVAFFLSNISLFAADSSPSFAEIIYYIETGNHRHVPNKLANYLLPFARNRHHILARGYLWLFHHYPDTFFKQKYNSTVEVTNIVQEFEIDMCLSGFSSLNPQQILWQKGEEIPSLTKKILLHYLEPAFCINEFLRFWNARFFPSPKQYQEILNLMVDCYINLSARSFCILGTIFSADEKDSRFLDIKYYLLDPENYQNILKIIQEKSIKIPHDSQTQQQISMNIQALIETVWQAPLVSAIQKSARSPKPSCFCPIPLTDGHYEYSLAAFCSLSYQQDYFITTSCCLGHPFSLALHLTKRPKQLPFEHFEFLYDGIPDDCLFWLHKEEPTAIDAVIQIMRTINPDKTSELITKIWLTKQQFSAALPKESIQKKPKGYLDQFNYSNTSLPPLKFPVEDDS